MADLDKSLPHRSDSTTSTRDAIRDKATTVIGDIAQELKLRAGEVVGTVSSKATNYADMAKGTIANDVESVASALRSAANEMSRGSASERTFSQIASGLADASDAMQNKDLGQIIGALSDYARRNPMIFLGSAVLVGFAATRFAKATTGPSQPGSTLGTGNDYERPDTSLSNGGPGINKSPTDNPPAQNSVADEAQGDWGD